LESAQVSFLLSVCMDLLDYWAQLFEIFG
jgi:hypothetical protein